MEKASSHNLSDFCHLATLVNYGKWSEAFVGGLSFEKCRRMSRFGKFPQEVTMSQENTAKIVSALADEMNRLAAILGVPGDWAVVATRSTRTDGYEIGYSEGIFKVRYIERLIHNDLMSRTSQEDVAYDATLTLVQELARAKHPWQRAWNVDHRRQLFPAELALLSKLSESWAHRREQEQADELKKNPFVDPPTPKQLMDGFEYYYVNSDLQRILGRQKSRNPE